MGVVRKWVFPILRLVLFLAIAVALVKIAFFPEVDNSSSPAFPGAEIVEPQIPVSIGTVRNDVSLDATVTADAAVPIKATLAGEVRKVYVAQGDSVDEGTPILVIRAELLKADGVSTYLRDETVLAPVAGVVSSLGALVGQNFAVGDSVGTVAPPTFHVGGPLAAEQLYRLTEMPTEAEVTISGGPAPFTCTGLTITTPLAGDTTEGAVTGPTISCSVPSDVTVFAGLTARLVIAGGIAEDVLVVPTTAVEGIADTGNVYLVLPNGSTETRQVTLGLNDGINVEIIDGLVEGDIILQFVPGASAIDPNLDPGFGGDCFDENGNPCPVF